MAGSAQRSDSIISDTFADSEDLVGRAKADGMAEQTAHRLALRLDWRLVGSHRATARCDARR